MHQKNLEELLEHEVGWSVSDSTCVWRKNNNCYFKSFTKKLISHFFLTKRVPDFKCEIKPWLHHRAGKCSSRRRLKHWQILEFFVPFFRLFCPHFPKRKFISWKHNEHLEKSMLIHLVDFFLKIGHKFLSWVEFWNWVEFWYCSKFWN